jgi:aminoglycoside N3'-acetyltransferase
MVRAYRDGGKLLMLGTLYDSSTYLHIVEAMLWNTMLEALPLSAAERAGMGAAELAAALPFPSIDRPALGGWWEGAGAARRVCGRVGAAECRLCAIDDYVDACRAEVGDRARASTAARWASGSH